MTLIMCVGRSCDAPIVSEDAPEDVGCSLDGYRLLPCIIFFPIFCDMSILVEDEDVCCTLNDGTVLCAFAYIYHEYQ